MLINIDSVILETTCAFNIIMYVQGRGRLLLYEKALFQYVLHKYKYSQETVAEYTCITDSNDKTCIQ